MFIFLSGLVVNAGFTVARIVSKSKYSSFFHHWFLLALKYKTEPLQEQFTLICCYQVVIGDQDGVLQSFSMKRGEQQMVFKTLPGPAVSRVCLGGAQGESVVLFCGNSNNIRWKYLKFLIVKGSLGSILIVFLSPYPGTIKDKIFISKRGEVHGYTKKGKLFLSFDTCLAESIKSMYGMTLYSFSSLFLAPYMIF